MATAVSRIVQFTAICGTPTAVELPAPPRGSLERVIFTQVDGELEAATCNIYDRRGACLVANDLNVSNSGDIVAVNESAGFVAITTAAAHALAVGDVIELKGLTTPTYNTEHTVTEIINETEVVTDVAYVSDESAGLWQTRPNSPTYAPVTHLVYTFTKASDADYTAFNLNRVYENSDNYTLELRTRRTALWLEVLTVGAAEPLKFQIAYTCRTDTVV